MAWTVLVVDDSRTIQHVVRMALNKTGFTVQSADNAADGFAAAKAQLPDIILVDVDLPDGDGYDLCRQIKRHDGLADTPVLLFIGVNKKQDIAKSKDVRAMGFFPKPFASQDLIDQLTMIAEAKSSPAPEATEPVARLEPEAIEPEPFEPELIEPQPIEAEPFNPELDLEPIPADDDDEEWALDDDSDLIRTDNIVAAAERDPLGMDDPMGMLQRPPEPASPGPEFGELDILQTDEPDEPAAGDEFGLETAPQPEPADGPVKVSQEEASFLLEEIEDDEDDAAAQADQPEALDDDMPAAIEDELEMAEAVALDDELELIEAEPLDDELEAIEAEPLDDELEAVEADELDEVEADFDELEDIEIEDLDDELELEAETEQPDELDYMNDLERKEIDRIRREPLSAFDSAPPQARDDADELADMQPAPEAFADDLATIQPEPAAESDLDSAPLSGEGDISLADAAPTVEADIDDDVLIPAEAIEADELAEIGEPEPAFDDDVLETIEDDSEPEFETAAELDVEPVAELELEAAPEPEPEPEPVDEVTFDLVDDDEQPEALLEDVEPEVEPEPEPEPLAAEASDEPAPPSGDDIVTLFRRAVREELASLPETRLAPAAREAIRDIVRDELAAAMKEHTTAADDAGANMMDHGELLSAVRQAVRHETTETIESVVVEAIDGMTRKVIDAATGPIGPAEMEDLVGRVAGQEIAVALEGLPKPPEPITPPTAEEIAEALFAKLAAPLDEIRATLAKLPEYAQLGEQVHTWLNSAIAELPTLEEIQGALPAGSVRAGGESVQLPGDLGPQLVAALNQVAGEKLEAIAWEIMPQLAENQAAPQAAAALDPEAIKAAVSEALAGIALPAPNASAPLDTDSLREVIRDELAGLMGHQLEAVAWEVVPELAERIIKKELDRLTS